MDKQKIKDQLHEIKTELAYMRGMITNICSHLQELKDCNVELSNPSKLPSKKLYEHPWYKYKRKELISSGNYSET